MNGNRQRRFSFAVWAFDGKHKITILASGMIQAKHWCLVKYETIGGFWCGWKKNTESAMCYLLTISLFGMQTANKNPLKRLCFSGFPNLSFSKGGATRNRTGDTRIFSPLLYQLSYGTLFACLRVQRYNIKFNWPNNISVFLKKLRKMGDLEGWWRFWDVRWWSSLWFRCWYRIFIASWMPAYGVRFIYTKKGTEMLRMKFFANLFHVFEFYLQKIFIFRDYAVGKS